MDAGEFYTHEEVVVLAASWLNNFSKKENSSRDSN
jgi:hypothetical protein